MPPESGIVGKVSRFAHHSLPWVRSLLRKPVLSSNFGEQSSRETGIFSVPASEDVPSLPASAPPRPIPALPLEKTAQRFGTIKPSDDPRAVKPRRNREALTGIQALSIEEVRIVLNKHLVEVLRVTAPILQGANAEELMPQFVLPNQSRVATLFTKELGRRLALDEWRVEVIVGHGTIGGIFAAGISQALIDERHLVPFLPIERNGRPGTEGYRFLCPDDEIRSILSGKRILLAMPAVTSSHMAQILEQVRLIESEQCAAQVLGIATIVEYGELPPELPLKVEALLRVN